MNLLLHSFSVSASLNIVYGVWKNRYLTLLLSASMLGICHFSGLKDQAWRSQKIPPVSVLSHFVFLRQIPLILDVKVICALHSDFYELVFSFYFQVENGRTKQQPKEECRVNEGTYFFHDTVHNTWDTKINRCDRVPALQELRV